jgi:hypothetical protein
LNLGENVVKTTSIWHVEYPVRETLLILGHLNDGVKELAVYSDGCNGGVLVIYDTEVPDPLLTPFTIPAGRVSRTEFKTKYAYALCNGLCLLERPDIRTSRECRHTAPDVLSGAVRAGRFVLSFSGYPEEVDEALMLYVATRLGYLSVEEALSIADTNQHDLYRRVFHPTSYV